MYLREGVNLVSSKGSVRKNGSLASLADGAARRVLAVHDEPASRKSNPFEAGLIRDIILARGVDDAE